ncbi:MAG: dienelactone hydrolase family protein [Planctomycetaceae bacterium]|nr:dienelactone hydrolase family protein [Planctomycetaceae bacterium]
MQQNIQCIRGVIATCGVSLALVFPGGIRHAQSADQENDTAVEKSANESKPEAHALSKIVREIEEVVPAISLSGETLDSESVTQSLKDIVKLADGVSSISKELGEGISKKHIADLASELSKRATEAVKALAGKEANQKARDACSSVIRAFGSLRNAFPGGRGGVTTITSPGSDELTLYADLYDAEDLAAPIILLFHQAGSSRGEYSKIAPQLVKQGYNAFALDARSGQAHGKTINQTAKQATDRKLDQNYLAAKPDLEHAIKWVRQLGYSGKLAIWGSSYSASLALLIASEQKDELSAVLSFSPSECIPGHGIGEAAGKVKIPVFATCPRQEQALVKAIVNNVDEKLRTIVVQEKGGVHGSNTLTTSPKATQEALWKQINAFLSKELGSSEAGEKKPAK